MKNYTRTHGFKIIILLVFKYIYNETLLGLASKKKKRKSTKFYH